MFSNKQRDTSKVLKKLIASATIIGMVFSTIPAEAAGIMIGSGASISVTGAGSISNAGDWDNNGTFTAGTGTVILNGSASATLEAGSSAFYNLTINKTSATDANDNVTIQTDALTSTGTLTITDGDMIQGTTDLTVNDLTLGTSGSYTNNSTGDLTISSSVSNAGTITMNGNGGGSGDNDDILIRSSSSGVQRDWQGSGSFAMTDIDVQDQTAISGTPPFVLVASGTNNGNNMNWLFGNGTLTNLDVQPTNLKAGAESDITVSFTLESVLPVDGKVIIDFGSGFNAAGLTTVTNVTNIDGNWAVALSDGDGTNDVVTLTRSGGTQIAAGTAVSFTLEDEVKNPTVSGSTGTYLISTQVSTGTTIDTGTASADTILPNDLTSGSVSSETNLSGAINAVTFTMTTSNDLPADGIIQITFPGGYDLSEATTVTSTDIDGTISMSIVDKVVTLTRSGGSVLVGGSTVDDLKISNIRNPISPGVTGNFLVQTQTGAAVAIDEGSFEGVTIVSSTNQVHVSMSATPQKVRIGQIVTFTVSLKNLTNYPLRDFNYVQELPAGLVLRSGTGHVNEGSFKSEVMTQEIRFQEFSAIKPGATRELSFETVVGSAGESGKFMTRGYVQINPIISNTALLQIQIVPDFVFGVGTLIGKVFWDKNGDGQQQVGELGIPNVRLGTEEGILLTTDEYGRYHIPDVNPGRHFIKIDSNSLPVTSDLSTARSVYFESTDAMLNKGNFGVLLDPNSSLARQLEGKEDPINVTIRSSNESPKPALDLTFDIWSGKSIQYPEENDLNALWEIPLMPRTNFPSFINRWQVQLTEVKIPEKKSKTEESLFDRIKESMKLEGETSERKALETMIGDGVLPARIPVKIKTREMLLDDRYVEVTLSVFDEKGQEARVKYALYAESDGEEIRAVLQDMGEDVMNLPLNGTELLIDGEAPTTTRVEIFGLPVEVDESGKFSTRVVLQEGIYQIPFDVYPNGFNPVDGTIFNTEPIRIIREFSARNNEFFSVGFIEYEAGHLSYSGAERSLSAQDKNRVENNIYQDLRLTYYARGKLFGKYFLTASIDTDRKRKEIYRTLEKEDYYGTYGDKSKIEYDATDTQDEVFLHLAWDQSYIRYGNFGTGFTGTEFADFTRSMHGLKVHYETQEKDLSNKAKTLTTAFYATGRQLASHIEFLATGGSLYYVQHRDVVSGSDKVKVVERDAVTGIAKKETPLRWGEDYEMDYNEGRLILSYPLGTYDFDSEEIISTGLFPQNPQYLVIDYEYDDPRVSSDKTTGFRLTREWMPGFRLGGTVVKEQRQLNDYGLWAIDGEYQYKERGKIHWELARSSLEATRNFVSYDGGLSFQESTVAKEQESDGVAWKIDGELKPWKTMLVKAYYQTLDTDFSSSDALTQAGTSKYGFSAQQQLGRFGVIRYNRDGQEVMDPSNEISAQGLGSRSMIEEWLYNYRKGKFNMGTAWRHSEVQEPVQFNEQYRLARTEDESLLAANLNYQFTERLLYRLSGQVNVQDRTNKSLRNSLIYNINPLTALTLMHVMGTRGQGVKFDLGGQLMGRSVDFENGFGSLSQSGQVALPGFFEQVKTKIFQETQLGFQRRIGPESEASVRQTVGFAGLGKRILSLKKKTEKETYSVTHSTEAGIETTAFNQESKVTENVSTYSNMAWNKNSLTGAAATSGIRGIKGTFGQNERLTLFQEEENALFGENRRGGRKSGAHFKLTPDFSIGLSYEKNQIKTNDQSHDSQAGKISLKYLKFDAGSFESDFEFRKSSETQDLLQMTATGSGEVALSKDTTLFGRYEWSATQDRSNGDFIKKIALFDEFQLGLAYRPVRWDWFNLLVEFKKNLNKGAFEQLDIDNLNKEATSIFRIEGAFDLNKYITIVEKFAIRKSDALRADPDSQDISSTTTLWGNRINIHLTDRLDLATEFRLLNQALADDYRIGIVTELSYRLGDAIRIAGGYNLMDFNARAARDLSVETKGFYLRIFVDAVEGARQVIEHKKRKDKVLAKTMEKFLAKSVAKDTSTPEVEEIRKYLLRSKILMNKGDYLAGVEELSEGLFYYQTVRKYADREASIREKLSFYFQQARLFFRHQKYQKSVEFLEKAALIDRSDPEVLDLLRKVKSEMENRSRIERDIRRQAHVRLRNLAGMVSGGEFILEVLRFHFETGQEYLEQGFYEAAIAEWNQGLQVIRKAYLTTGDPALRELSVLPRMEQITQQAQRYLDQGDYLSAQVLIRKGMNELKDGLREKIA